MPIKNSTPSRALPTTVSLTLTAVAALLIGCSGGGGSDTEQIAAAKVLIEKKDAKAAVIQLKSALQANPKSAEARLLLGKTLLQGGDPVAAMVELLKAQELQVPDDQVIPEIARAMLAVGDTAKLLTQYGTTVLKDNAANADFKTSLAAAYAVKNDMPKASETLEEALKSKPGFAPAIVMQARVKAAGGEIDPAIALLDQVLVAEAGNERAAVLKSEFLLMGKRDVEGATATLRKVMAANAEANGARASLTNILLAQNKLPEAKVEFEQLKKASPNNPETQLIEAQLAFNEGNTKLTLEITERLLKAMPENPRVLELAGAAALRTKNFLVAESHLSQALKAAPKAPRPRLLLTQTYLRSGQADKALELLKPVLESGQADALTLSLAGEAYLQTGDNKRSEEAFAKALKAAPGNAAVRTSAAIAQVARGDSSNAAISELEAVASGDTSTRGDLALISARLRQKDTAGALKAIAALEKKTPDQPLPALLRGRVLVLTKDVPGATASFEAALAKDPAYFPAVASLAALDLAGGKPEKARERFEAHLKAQPKSFQAKLALAELEARTGAPTTQVVATLREATKINPSEPVPHLTLIRRLIAARDTAGALQAAQDGSAALPNNLDIMEALGEAQITAGDSQRAISTFKKLTSLQPKSASYQVRLADAYRAAKDNAAAGVALKRALELEPDMTPARGALIGLALSEKRPQDGLALAREQQKRKPTDAAGFQLEAEVHAAQRNWEEAIGALRTAVKLEPSAGMNTRLHAALMAGGKTSEAERLAADWTKANPKDPIFRFYLGDLAMARKDLAGAETLYRSVLELQPGNALAMNNLAWMMASQNKPGAVAMATKANELLPDRAPLVDTLSLALEAENQLPKAIEAQARAVKLQPDDPTLVLRLGKLYIKSGDKARAKAELESLAKLGDKFGGQAEVASLLKTL